MAVRVLRWSFHLESDCTRISPNVHISGTKQSFDVGPHVNQHDVTRRPRNQEAKDHWTDAGSCGHTTVHGPIAANIGLLVFHTLGYALL